MQQTIGGSEEVGQSLHMFVVGIPLVGDGKSQTIRIIQWLGANGLKPRFADYRDAAEIVEAGYWRADEVARRFGMADSMVVFGLNVQWGQRGDRDVEVQVETWEAIRQQNIRMNIEFLPRSAPLLSLDRPAEHAAEWAWRLHRAIGADVSLIDTWPTADIGIGGPPMRLLAGWFSAYGKDMMRRYGLLDIDPVPSTIAVSRDEGNIAFRNRLSFSEYLVRGWDREAVRFWSKLGGEPLRRSR